TDLLASFFALLASLTLPLAACDALSAVEVAVLSASELALSDLLLYSARSFCAFVSLVVRSAILLLTLAYFLLNATDSAVLYVCEKAGTAPMINSSTGKRKIFFILFCILFV